MVDNRSSSGLDSARFTFYRKNFTKAKGCISEVNELADAASLLCEACAQAVDGTADIEQVRALFYMLCSILKVMSHVKNLKTSLAQLKTTASIKFAGSTAEHYDLLDDLQQATNTTLAAIKDLSTKVDILLMFLH